MDPLRYTKPKGILLQTRALRTGASVFGIEMSFFVVSRWPKSPFWYRDLLFGIEILHTLLFGIEIVFFLGSTRACFSGRSKRSRYRKEDQKNLDEKKKTSRYQLKESPFKDTLTGSGAHPSQKLLSSRQTLPN